MLYLAIIGLNNFYDRIKDLKHNLEEIRVRNTHKNLYNTRNLPPSLPLRVHVRVRCQMTQTHIHAGHTRNKPTPLVLLALMTQHQ